jgi:hypothetical protein
MLLATLISTVLIAAQPAVLPPGARAVLVTPGEARTTMLDGRSWACGPDGACVGRGGGVSQPALRECRRFTARFGAVTRYERDGVGLTEAELAQCNAALSR